MIEFLLESKLYLGFIFEVLAAVAGFLYLKKSQQTLPEIKIFIFYLLYIVIIEFYLFIPIYAWVNDYKVLGFYEHSIFRRSLWVGNLNQIIYAICFSQIFIRSLGSHRLRKRLFTVLFILVGFSVIRFITSGEFFHSADLYVLTLQTFFVLICVGFYYFEILKTDRVLRFHRNIKFYISLGVVLWNLCVFPLDIYGEFFNLRNPYFIKVNTAITQYANVFLYSIYTFGFYIDYYRKPKNSKNLEQSS